MAGDIYIYIETAAHTNKYTENGTNGNGNFHLFVANKKRKWQTSICLLQTEMENGSLFSLVGKL
jgi:hypothetical protein